MNRLSFMVRNNNTELMLIYEYEAKNVCRSNKENNIAPNAYMYLFIHAVPLQHTIFLHKL